MLTGQLVWVRAWLCRKRLRKDPPPPPCRRSGGVPRSRLPGSKVPCAKPRSVPAGQLAGAGVCAQGTTSPSQRRSAAGSREIGRIIFYRTPGWDASGCHVVMLVALSSPSTPGLGGPVPHDAPGAHPAQGVAFAMVAYAGDRQPIYMPRFGFYVAPRPTNKQSILYTP